MGVADEDLQLRIDLRPDGVRLHRLSVEAHLPEIDGVTWAQVSDLWRAARDEAGREAALHLGWGSAGVRFYRALDSIDNVFGAGGSSRSRLKIRLDQLFREQRGGGAPLPAAEQTRPPGGYSKPSTVSSLKKR